MTSSKPLALLVAAYTAALLALTGLPWCDLPGHLARIAILGKILFSSGDYYGRHYSFHWMFAPYILWDLLAAVTGRFLPLVANGLLWTAIAFLGVVASGWHLAKVRLRSSAQVRTLAVLSVLIASGWFFAMGFFAYQLGFALSLTALALGHGIRRAGARATAGRHALYALTVAACYLAHLGGYLGLCLISGAAGLAAVLENRRNVRRELGLLAPPSALVAWHALAALSSDDGRAGVYVYGAVSRKFLALSSPWLRLPLRWDWPLAAGVALSLLLLAFRARRALKTLSPRALLTDDAFLAVAFLSAAYAILPQGGLGGWDDDTRMLPYLFYFSFLWLASLQPRADGAGARPTGPEAVLLATAWIALFALVVQLWPYNRRMRDYRDLLGQIPPRKLVLPVSTEPPLGRLAPTLHQGDLYAALREGSTPYLFARRNGPIPFFDFREGSGAPDIFWYVRSLPPEWGRMSPPCDYVVVAKPFDPARLPPVGPIFFENESAAVFRMAAPATEN